MKLLIPAVTVGAGTDSPTEVGQELTVRSTTLDCVNATDKPTETGAVNIPWDDACDVLVLGIDGLTSPICSNVVTFVQRRKCFHSAFSHITWK